MNVHNQRPDWIGFDLDGTFAYYDKWRGDDHIGEPIKPMIEILKNHLAEGNPCRIFTARANNGIEAIYRIQDWLEEQGLRRLPVTSRKDYGMIMCYDDRCIQVERNTGKLIHF